MILQMILYRSHPALQREAAEGGAPSADRHTASGRTTRRRRQPTTSSGGTGVPKRTRGGCGGCRGAAPDVSARRTQRNEAAELPKATQRRPLQDQLPRALRPRLFQKASTKILLYLIAIGQTVTPMSKAPLLNITLG